MHATLTLFSRQFNADFALLPGLQWLASAVEVDFDSLDARVERDIVSQKDDEALFYDVYSVFSTFFVRKFEGIQAFYYVNYVAGRREGSKESRSYGKNEGSGGRGGR